MCVEIEAKLKVDSLPDVESKLKELGAEFIAEQSQSDVLFDDANATLIATDQCLRLRSQSIGDSKKFFLTYKGAKEQSDFKKRQEIEIEINSAEMAQRLFLALGYQKILVVKKIRRLWRFGHCDIALDHLSSLGNFVEIEGPDDKIITDVQKRLGLAHLPPIANSYAQMIKEKLDLCEM
ncbi:class IV adenylate cyclase [Planctomycetota bacterium]